MRVKDRFQPRGAVRLEVWRDGRRELVEHPNLITRLGRERFARIFGGDPTAERPWEIAIGEGGLPASPDDTDLTMPFARPFSAEPTYAGASVTFQTTFEESDAVGLPVRELGLRDADGFLFARWVRQGGLLVKADDMRLLAFWTIQF